MSESIGIVGLGLISGFHVQALEELEGVKIIGGVDIDPTRELVFRGRPKAVHSSVEELLGQRPDTIIVATPTTTHYGVCQQILRARGDKPERLIVEKPLSLSLPEVEELLTIPPEEITVDVVYHAAYAPEVLWARDQFARWTSRWGK